MNYIDCKVYDNKNKLIGYTRFETTTKSFKIPIFKDEDELKELFYSTRVKFPIIKRGSIKYFIVKCELGYIQVLTNWNGQVGEILKPTKISDSQWKK